VKQLTDYISDDSDEEGSEEAKVNKPFKRLHEQQKLKT
jgi:hypothetical protein